MGLKSMRVDKRLKERLPLKSDQNGIEIQNKNKGSNNKPKIKIRPKWD